MGHFYGSHASIKKLDILDYRFKEPPKGQPKIVVKSKTDWLAEYDFFNIKTPKDQDIMERHSPFFSFLKSKSARKIVLTHPSFTQFVCEPGRTKKWCLRTSKFRLRKTNEKPWELVKKIGWKTILLYKVLELFILRGLHENKGASDKVKGLKDETGGVLKTKQYGIDSIAELSVLFKTLEKDGCVVPKEILIGQE